MLTIQSQDYFSLRSMTLFSATDTEVLYSFYQPFIGAFATSLYITLHELFRQHDYQMLPYLQLIQSTQGNLTDLLHARRTLEAIGLLRTYQLKKNQSTVYTFVLYAVKTPEAVFSDPLLKGLLTQALGDKGMRHLVQRYALPPLDDIGVEVSASFSDVFHPDLNHPAFLPHHGDKLQGKTTHTIRKAFDQVAFETILTSQFHIQANHIAPALMQQLVDIAMLTGLDETALAEHVVSTMDLMTNEVNLEQLLKLASEEKKFGFIQQRKQQLKLLSPTSDIAEAVNQMEILTPVEFLRLKQGGHDPALADVYLVRDLKLKKGLTNPVINALVHYVLLTQHNTLPRAYVEKIAANLGRENYQHAIDTLDYFEKVNDKEGALMSRRLAREEGLLMGYSAGTAVAGLLKMKDRFKEDDVVVIIFHDHGSRYVGKIYNDEWMRERGFLEDSLSAKAILKAKGQKTLITIE